MNKKNISIYDISKELGLSPATISRVLNHPEQVKKETRERVLSCIQDTGFRKRSYVSSYEPKNLFQGDSSYSNLYLMSIPSASNPFYADIIEGTMTAAAQHNCSVFVDYTPINEKNISAFLGCLSEFRGLLSLQALSERLLHQITSHIPVVQCSEQAPKYPDVSTITIDNVQAEKKTVEYLISLGCRSFSFMTSMSDYRFAEDRLYGMKLALEGAMLSISNDQIIRVSSMEYQTAYDAALEYLKKEHPDAVVCISDVFAAACINAAHTLSIRIPEDMMVTGFDNTSTAVTTNPSITTIAQPRFQLGFHAFEALYRETHSQVPHKTHMILATELLIRQSTGGKIQTF